MQIETPLGPLSLAASSAGLARVALPGPKAAGPAGDTGAAARRHLDGAARALAAYFAGEREDFDDLALDLAGSPFERAVWDALREIPFGETRSYGEIAERVGQPGAARAVGVANHRNPVAVIVPCHRVIGADGGLVGYGGGLDRKRWLLKHEGALLV